MLRFSPLPSWMSIGCHIEAEQVQTRSSSRGKQLFLENATLACHFIFRAGPFLPSQCCTDMHVLQRALASGKQPNAFFLPQLTKVHGFGPTNAAVAVAAGYTFWVALTANGEVFTCDTAFDGYAGNLPESASHGGWHPINRVRHVKEVEAVLYVQTGHVLTAACGGAGRLPWQDRSARLSERFAAMAPGGPGCSQHLGWSCCWSCSCEKWFFVYIWLAPTGTRQHTHATDTNQWP
jgi:hypothetical protein